MDRLVSQVLGAVGKLRKVYRKFEISLFLIRRLLGARTKDKKQIKISKVTKNELLLINIGLTSTDGRVLSMKGDLAKIQLTSSTCWREGRALETY
ncbi:initiation factor eIF2 gamma, C terminal-domain-containing protein [Suillus plorans]|uniref:Initiation factor eIF2 gamma, C terminal-domain-containing protein n=1 Tax=Suillus plorans TaxID=116603 RepID=A0A9P7A8X5_9AGAM|nr:initiation factor eIF2 gamma, C terminal-domain-containing protein [Suillus plorans]KAG1784654.1 initiation factor eIF2 gamma, C terminal-domain-containing protein [Suillus plorans]